MKFNFKKNDLFSKITFRKRITMSLIAMSLIMTIYMGFSSYKLSSKIILDKSARLAENNFGIAYKTLDDYFSNVGKYVVLLIRMPALRNITKNANTINSEQDKFDAELDSSIREILNLASADDKISFNIANIYLKNGYSYKYFNNTELPYESFESCINYYIDNNYINEGYKPSTWCNVIKTTDELGRQNYSFINIRILYDAVTLNEIGVLITGINEDDLNKIYSDFSDKAFIMHKNGMMISHNDKSLLGSLLSNGTPYRKIIESKKTIDTLSTKNSRNAQLITYKMMAGNDVYFVIPFDYYNGNEISEARTFVLSIFIITFMGFLMSIVFASLLSKGLSSSILALKKTVQAVYNGNLNARFISKRNDEVAYLGERFNAMLEQINNFFLKQKEQESTNRILELNLLQSQINPHLLYNTLDSVLWALEDRNTSQAKDLIVSLSEFFKISLSGGNALITIKKELDHVRYYIQIQRIARGKNIKMEINVPQELLDCEIIKLSFQPIVENAIRHGFSGYRDDGTIIINITNPEIHCVQIIIEDNGIGILDNDLEILNKTLESYPIGTEIRHFGLYNIQRRIKNLFGDGYGISLVSEVGVFTRVIIKIPYNIGKSEENGEDV